MRLDGLVTIVIAVLCTHVEALVLGQYNTNSSGLMKRSARCGTNLYNDDALQRGFEHAIQAVRTNAKAKFNAKKEYPAEYRNEERLSSSSCKVTQNLWEFPVSPDGRLYTHGPPGPDRAVVLRHGDGTYTQCWFMTHTGAPQKNGFVRC